MTVAAPSDVLRQVSPAGSPLPWSARRRPSTLQSAEAARASLALHNLRGAAIAFVVMMHASIAYLASADANVGFDQPPYRWLSFPVLDQRRWLGFDVFCAWQDVYLMALMFFLSGVFAGPSLERDGSLRFFARRLARLGGALLFGVAVVMPVALYPVYRLSAADPSLMGYLSAYRALPFLPNGPMWFLWVLLALDAVAVALHRSHRVRAAASTVEAFIETRPVSAFAAFAAIAFAVYAPLAVAFTPWRWTAWGPFASRPLLHAACFFLGSFSAVGVLAEGS